MGSSAIDCACQGGALPDCENFGRTRNEYVHDMAPWPSSACPPGSRAVEVQCPPAGWCRCRGNDGSNPWSRSRGLATTHSELARALSALKPGLYHRTTPRFSGSDDQYPPGSFPGMEQGEATAAPVPPRFSPV